jgi:hypothetical protein
MGVAERLEARRADEAGLTEATGSDLIRQV